MSLITRCPACETLFKVVPDQLRISEGWVRCGQCDEVFDASAHLVKEVPAASVPPEASQEPAPGPQPTVEMAQEDPQAIASQFLDLDLDFSEIDSTESPLVNLDFGGESTSLNADHVLTDPLAAESISDADLQVSRTGVVSEPGPEPAMSESDMASPTEVSFLRSQRHKSSWNQPLVRIGLSALVVALLLTLVGQFAFHERDRLAAHEPRLTPWLLAFCAPLGCSLSLVQRIESVVIDSSSFARIRGETYRLSFTLKNTSTMPLDLPAVELTLTDALDQPVMRRVVLTSELGALPDTLGAGVALPVARTFLVKLDAASERMAGYRLLAFYP